MSTNRHKSIALGILVSALGLAGKHGARAMNGFGGTYAPAGRVAPSAARVFLSPPAGYYTFVRSLFSVDSRKPELPQEKGVQYVTSQVFPQFNGTPLHLVDTVAHSLAYTIYAAEVSVEQAKEKDAQQMAETLAQGRRNQAEALQNESDHATLDMALLTMEHVILPAYIYDKTAVTATGESEDFHALKGAYETGRERRAAHEAAQAKDNVDGIAYSLREEAGSMHQSFDTFHAAHAPVDDRPIPETQRWAGLIHSAPSVFLEPSEPAPVVSLEAGLSRERAGLQKVPDSGLRKNRPNKAVIRARNEAQGLVSLLFKLDEDDYAMNDTIIEPLKDLVLRSEDERVEMIAMRGLGRYLTRTREYADETKAAMTVIARKSRSAKVQEEYLRRGIEKISTEDIQSIAVASKHLSVKKLAVQFLIKEARRYDSGYKGYKNRVFDAALAVVKSDLKPAAHYEGTEDSLALQLAKALAEELHAYKSYDSYAEGLVTRLKDLGESVEDDSSQFYIVQEIFLDIGDSADVHDYARFGIKAAAEIVAKSRWHGVAITFAQGVGAYLKLQEDYAYADEALGYVEQQAALVEEPTIRGQIVMALREANETIANAELHRKIKELADRIEAGQATVSQPVAQQPKRVGLPFNLLAGFISLWLAMWTTFFTHAAFHLGGLALAAGAFSFVGVYGLMARRGWGTLFHTALLSAVFLLPLGLGWPVTLPTLAAAAIPMALFSALTLSKGRLVLGWFLSLLWYSGVLAVIFWSQIQPWIKKELSRMDTEPRVIQFGQLPFNIVAGEQRDTNVGFGRYRVDDAQQLYEKGDKKKAFGVLAEVIESNSFDPVAYAWYRTDRGFRFWPVFVSAVSAGDPDVEKALLGLGAKQRSNLLIRTRYHQDYGGDNSGRDLVLRKLEALYKK